MRIFKSKVAKKTWCGEEVSMPTKSVQTAKLKDPKQEAAVMKLVMKEVARREKYAKVASKQLSQVLKEFCDPKEVREFFDEYLPTGGKPDAEEFKEALEEAADSIEDDTDIVQLLHDATPEYN